MLVWPPGDPEASPATYCIRVGSTCSIPHTRHLQHAGNMVVMGNHLLGALCQGCHGCLCDFPSYQPLPISEEMDKLVSMVKSQERSLCAQGFAVPDNWITGARNQ